MIGASGETSTRVFVPEWQQSMITVRFTSAGSLSKAVRKPVVRHRVFPVEICRAENLVAAIGFIAVVVGHVRAVAGVVEKQHVAALGALKQACDAVLHGLLRGLEVGENFDVFFLKGEVLQKRCFEVVDVVDAAAEVGSGDFVTIDANEECLVHR